MLAAPSRTQATFECGQLQFLLILARPYYVHTLGGLSQLRRPHLRCVTDNFATRDSIFAHGHFQQTSTFFILQLLSTEVILTSIYFLNQQFTARFS